MIRTLATLALIVLCSPVVAQTPPGFPQRPTPYQRQGEVDCFRPAVVFVSDADAYKAWAIEQNEIAYENAARLRDEVNGGIGGTVIRETTVYGPSAGVRRGGFNNYRTGESTTIAPGATRFGGGPVWIINPFCTPSR